MTHEVQPFPPVWRSLRAPLCPAAWRYSAQLDGIFGPRSGERRAPESAPPRTRRRRASGTPATFAAWCDTAIGAVSALRSNPTGPAMLRAVLDGHADRDERAIQIPFLTASLDILDAIGLPIDDVIAWLCEVTPLELFDQLEASNDPRWAVAALDLPITGDAWAPRVGTAARQTVSIAPDSLANELRALARARMDAAGMGHTLEYSDAVADLWGACGAPTTLAAAASEVGLTRERIRQINELVLADIAEFDRRFPARTFDAVNDDLTDRVPDSQAAVERALALANDSCTFTLETARNFARARGGASSTSPSWADAAWWAERSRATNEMRSAIRKAGRSCITKLGFTTMTSVMEALSDSGIEEDDVVSVLSDSPDWMVLPEGWLYNEASASTTMRNCLARMLSVHTPLSIAELHAGLSRFVVMRQIEDPPPARIVAALLKEHTAFEVVGDLVSEIEPRTFPDDTIQAEIVTLLRTSQHQAMHRNEVMETLVRKGRNPTSVSMYLTYGLTIKPCGGSVYCPIGCSVDDATISLIRARASAIAVRGSLKQTVEGGKVVLSGVLSTAVFTSGVISLKVATRALINERHFDVLDDRGAHIGSAKGVASGPLVGLLTAISHVDLFPGDRFRLVLNPADGTAVLSAED